MSPPWNKRAEGTWFSSVIFPATTCTTTGCTTGADFGTETILWVSDRGESSNARSSSGLYPDRQTWLLEEDGRSCKLSPSTGPEHVPQVTVLSDSDIEYESWATELGTGTNTIFFA